MLHGSRLLPNRTTTNQSFVNHTLSTGLMHPLNFANRACSHPHAQRSIRLSQKDTAQQKKKNICSVNVRLGIIPWFAKSHFGLLVEKSLVRISQVGIAYDLTMLHN